MHKTVIPAKKRTVIPANAGIHVFSFVIIITLVSYANKNLASAQTLKKQSSSGHKHSIKHRKFSMEDLSLDSLNHIYFPGSGGRPATAEEEHEWRWKVKTMQDDTGNNWQSRYGMPYQRNFTIRELLDLKPEMELEEDTGEPFIPVGKIRANTPRLWSDTFLHEYQIISIEAKITAYYIEPDDKDIHLVLSDSEGNTMIAEVPYWEEVGTWAKPYVEAVWKKLIEYFGRPRTRQTKLKDIGPVFVVGMPFIDKGDHGKGAARNGIEIHPVLGISLTDDN